MIRKNSYKEKQKVFHVFTIFFKLFGGVMSLIKSILMVILFSSFSLSQYLDMNDVTILLPLPKPGEENLLIKTSDLTRTGKLLFPADKLFVGFQLDVQDSRNRTRQTEDFRVIGIRVDHFLRQLYINLVWQKIENGRIDKHASIHSSHTILDLPLFLKKLEDLNIKNRRRYRVGRFARQHRARDRVQLNRASRG